MNKTGISRVIMHRDRRVTVLQSMFDGKLGDEFVAGVRKLVPATIKIKQYRSGLYNGGGDANKGGFTRSGITFTLVDTAQAPELRKLLQQAAKSA